MGKYFGTDGIRGVANSELTPELAMKLGRILGAKLSMGLGAKLVAENEGPKVLIGRDTRISGEMLEASLMAGLISSGVSVMKLDVITTPGVAYLTKSLDASAGIMISASHNPVADNGIKIFGADGYKLTDDQEAEIEALLDKEDDLPRPTGGKIGIIEDFKAGSQKYLNFLKTTIDTSLEGLKVVLDCANGAAYGLAGQLFTDLGAEVVLTYANPNGVNINEECGSTHPEKLQEAVLANEADLGLAFDGDCDRLIAVDEEGEIVDGDQIMFIMGRYLKEQGKLKQDTIVATVMSNLGFHKAAKEAGIKTIQTKVGDRYVLEEIIKSDYNLGGEQSGHIIFLDYASTGDGLLGAIQLAAIIKDSGKKTSELASDMTKFPQLLKNIKVVDKAAMLSNEAILAKIKEVETKMNGEGRVLVRPSGTEPLVRVMVEAQTDELCVQYVDKILEVVAREIK